MRSSNIRGRRSSVLESLEQRRLLDGTVDLAINFGPKRVPGVAGYFADVGEVYGDRGNGNTFGWDAYNAANGRDRNLLADQRLDTLTHLQRGGNKTWEIALPNGQYQVTVTAGDALFFDSVNVINVEGVNVVNATPSAASPFATKTRVVTVSDGKLTVRRGSGAVNAKINSIRIQSAGDDGTIPPPATSSTVAIAVIDPTVDEGTTNTGLVRLTRSGDTAAVVTVALDWSGAGGNKKDLTSPRPDTVTFAAGQTLIDLPIVAAEDALDERPEAVWVTLKSGTGYSFDAGNARAIALIVGQTQAASALKNIAWTTGLSSPSAHTEAQTAVISGRFYRFGGYDGNYSAVRRVERYDPATNTWTRFGDMPIGLSHSGAAVVGTKVWFAGAYAERVGFPGQQDIGIKGVYVYDSVTDTWGRGPDLPDVRGAGNMANVNGVLYFIGGETTARVDQSTVWALDTNNVAAGWVRKTDIPEARNHFGIAALDGKIYVFGGQTGHDDAAVPLKTSYVYDVAANTWTRKADMPSPISHIQESVVVYKSKIYAFGGNNPVNVINSIAREYDPATDKWRLLSDIPSARSGASAAVIGDTFYLNGGRTPQAQWTSDLFVGTVVV